MKPADNFDLKKYLANNPLLENKLSSQEQDIVDDILSVSEGIKDIMDKIKSYAKKGLLTAVILTAIVSQLKAQGDIDTANQVQKVGTELIITPGIKNKENDNIMIWEKSAGGVSFGKIEYNPQTKQYTLSADGAKYIPSQYVGVSGIYKYTGKNVSSFKDKQNFISALEAGLQMLNMENPEPGTRHTANVEGITISKGDRNMFSIGDIQFTKGMAKNAIQDLQNFTP
jgi:hypothetical protein